MLARLLIILLLMLPCADLFAVPPPYNPYHPTTSTSTTLHSSPNANSYSAAASLLIAKADLLNLGQSTNRGFTSTPSDKQKLSSLISTLTSSTPNSNNVTATDLIGKWTLIYTDAPDITSLDSSPATRLGRIGQEIESSGSGKIIVKNVIEYLRPKWLDRLPLPTSLIGGSDNDARVIQKVVTEGKSNSRNGKLIELAIKGAEIYSEGDDDNLPLALKQLKERPVDLKGVGGLPFGSFEILYLDEGIRIVRTSNNHIAVNVKDDAGSAWF
ncbi:hypothetical protein TrLO_g8824 [Triparma laevis f. longispina]|uniref:Plastid lipid-associated protein/fibrillin conserved domain-containing protein n=1 Tax=Triparma laevis f. longispina TaxID=1714387 RepID=A0A9W7A4Y0_9STRA|nr:hypothetical protein TrLO_g8824 [Triparma laevis f. longispina]